MIKAITENITLENVKKSNYWELIAILVWNHYREEKYKDESQVEITESWYGQAMDHEGSSHSTSWDNPDHKEKGYIRKLGSIDIKLTRTDYVTYICINTKNGNINCFGSYTDREKKVSPNYRNNNQIDVINWLLKHSFVELNNNNYEKRN